MTGFITGNPPEMLPLLRTKITIPPLRIKRVERSRLVDKIHKGMARPLTLVVAPAGFGKTTLLVEWADLKEMPVAWLSLESTERTLERFLAYFIHSVQQIDSKIGQTALALLQGGQAVANEAIIYTLLNDLSEITYHFALVLDDYHAADSVEVSQIVQFLLERCPEHFHLAITSRSVPGINLTRLLAQDKVTEVSAVDLRFNLREIGVFLETVMGAHLNPKQIDNLDHFTEGWAVGLQLAGLAITHQSNEWIIPPKQTRIFEYLAQEVLQNESSQVQEFLIKTSLFDRFCVDLCEHIFKNKITEKGQSVKKLLTHIERGNLFLVPLDSEGMWFRYHALFADFLRQQLDPEQTKQLYHLASLWFEQNDLIGDAIHYATHAADFTRAADLIESNYRNLVQLAQHNALSEWLAALPVEMFSQRPRLLLAKGWTGIIGLDLESVEITVDQIETLIGTTGLQPDHSGLEYGVPTNEKNRIVDPDSLRGELKSLQILSAVFQGRIPPAEVFSEAFVLLSEKDDFLHSLLHLNLGLRHVLTGETRAAVEAFDEAVRIAVKLNIPLLAIVAGTQMGEQQQIRGELALAERTFHQIIRYAQTAIGEHTFLLGMPYVSYADLLREQNQFEKAIEYAEQGIKYCHTWMPMASLDGHLALMRLEAGRGDETAFFMHFKEAIKDAENSNSILDDSFVVANLIHVLLLHGDLAQADRWAQAYHLQGDNSQKNYYFQEIQNLALCRSELLRYENDPERANKVVEKIDELLPGIEKRERMTSFIEGLILRSYALHIAGRHDESASSLSRALMLGELSGFLRLFVDEGKRLLHQIEQYRARLVDCASYLKILLPLLGADHFNPNPTGNDLIALTRREADILQLMAEGKSNQEIAHDLVLALNTVKKHVANVLNKMGVANRTTAVSVARERGWIK